MLSIIEMNDDLLDTPMVLKWLTMIHTMKRSLSISLCSTSRHTPLFPSHLNVGLRRNCHFLPDHAYIYNYTYMFIIYIHIYIYIYIKYPEKISSNTLYERCECGPMSVSAIKARWGMFGHVMRMAHETPAQMAIDEYITPTATAGWQGRPRTTLPTTLDNDRQGVGETAPQQARLATFKNICIRQKSMAYP